MPEKILVAKGKQGKMLDTPTYAVLGIEAIGQAFIEVEGDFGGLPSTIATYSFGLKGKPKDYIITAQPGPGDDDFVTTGAGNDTISAGGGNDIIVSGDGNDILNGAAGNDILIGGLGDDTFNAGSGFNYIDGGEGTDTYNLSNNVFGSDIVVDLADGTMTVDRVVTDYLVRIENVLGSSSRNTIIGSDGVNALESGTGGATFVGNGGADTLTLNGTANEIYWAAGDGTDTIWLFDADNVDDDMLYIHFVGDQGSDVGAMVAGGYLSFGGDSNTTEIWVDLDGAGDTYESELAAEIEGHGFTDEATSIALFGNNIADDDFAFV